jgi:hypothetical protein
VRSRRSRRERVQGNDADAATSARTEVALPTSRRQGVSTIFVQASSLSLNML